MKDKISISLKIPENLLNDGRTYSMLRYHNGQASVLDTTESEGTVTFSTDGFSTYSTGIRRCTGAGDSDRETDCRQEQQGYSENGYSNQQWNGRYCEENVCFS